MIAKEVKIPYNLRCRSTTFSWAWYGANCKVYHCSNIFYNFTFFLSLAVPPHNQPLCKQVQIKKISIKKKRKKRKKKSRKNPTVCFSRQYAVTGGAQSRSPKPEHTVHRLWWMSISTMLIIFRYLLVTFIESTYSIRCSQSWLKGIKHAVDRKSTFEK